MKKLVLLLMVVFCVVSFVGAKKMWIWNTDKGDGPNDFANCTTSMSEENAAKKGGVSLKIEPDPKTEFWFIGEMPAKRSWDGFDILKFSVYNPGKTPVPFTLTIKASPNVYEKRIDASFIARPGLSEQEYELTGACSNDGSAYDFKKKIPQWNFNSSNKDTLYFSAVRLETGDEAEKEEKPTKKK